jgi:membrane protein
MPDTQPVRARVGGDRRLQAWFRRTTGHPLVVRLQAVDVVNRGMLFAAVLLLCFVPCLIVVRALAGRSATTGMVERFGLTHAAAEAVSQALTSPTATSGSVTGLSWVFVVLGGVGAAAAIQELYERAFDVPSRGFGDTPRRLLWLLVLLGAVALAGWAQPWLHDVGGPVLVGTASLVTSTAFWWFSMWLLLGGRLSWRELFPSALATGVCWLVMEIGFRLTMSATITSDYRRYGAVGVVFAVMSFLVAVGVVVVLGAVLGLVWREHRQG